MLYVDTKANLFATRTTGLRLPWIRRVTVAVLIAAIAACGGGGGDGPPGGPTTPNPPSAGAPASLAVAAGNGQSAFPGTELAIAPSVTVRDVSGQPVPGATVTFAIESGGGLIAGAAATSNAQGVATAGAWRLGTNGAQVLEARLGGLTPARFHATIFTGPVEAVVPATGGVIEITTPGHPFQGLTLTIPPGAYGEPGTWRFELDPDAPAPGFPAGLTVNGPALRVETDRLRAGRLMTLRVPSPRVAGTVRLFVLVDPARGAMEMAPIVAEDSESITVAVGHLNASLLLARGGPGAPAQAQASMLLHGYGFNVSATLSALGLTEALAGFLGNAWPAVETGSYAFPAGHGPAIALMNLFGHLQNLSYGGLITVWPSLGLLADTAAFAGLQIMADRHRRNVVAQQALDDLSAALSGNPVATRDSLAAINLAGGFLVSKLPQLMVFEERLGTTPGRRVFASMFGKGNGSLWFASPTSPSTQSALTLGPGGFGARMAREVADATPFDAQGVLPVGGSLVYPVADFADVVPTMVNALRAQGSVRDQLNRSLAAAAGFPTVTLEVQGVDTGAWSPADTTIVIRDSTAALRVQCSDCIQAIPMNGSATEQAVAVENSAPRGFVGSPFWLGPASTATMLNALGVGDLKGAVMTRMDASVTMSTLGAAYRQAVPINQRLALDLFRLTPDSQRVTNDSLVSLQATLDLPPAGGYAIDWDFGDGSPVVRTTNVDVVSHRFTTAGTWVVRAVLRTGAASMLPDVLLASATGTVVVTVPKQAWRLSSLTKVAEVGTVDPNDPGAFWGGGTDGLLYGGLFTQHRLVMHPLLTNPQDGVLYRYAPSASFPQAFGVQRVPVGTDPNLQLESKVLLAATCTFAGCAQWWSLNITGDNSSGGISGFAVLSTIAAIKGPDGVTLTGTFRVAEGGVPVVDGQPALRPLHYIDYSFTAVRVP